MQVTTDLNEMFNYSILPLTIVILILLIAILFFVVWKKIRSNRKIVVVQLPKKNRDLIKNRYLILINDLVVKYNKKEITNRLAYQKLSKIIRDFIYEMTSIKVQYYTLSDIKKINMPVLHELVEEYYNPEFAKADNGNFASSIEKTSQVILKWN